MDDLTGQLLGGEYRLTRLLQRGGMGAVYEAVQEPLGRKVAVKILHKHLEGHADQVERFRREAEAAAQLGHPHIVQVTDFSVRPGEPPFLVMEYLSGKPLSEVLEEGGMMPAERVAHIASQVLDGLSAAHAAGIVHRDLKPANIILTSSKAVRDVVTLVDFGIAKLLESSQKLTVTGSLVGTPAYMSPEQARGEEVDGRADLFALGVIMFGALAGRLPYDSKEPGEIIKALLNQPPPPLVEIRPDIDPGFVEIVERALAKSRDDRYPSADAMRRDIQRWLRRAAINLGSLDGGVPVPEPTPAPESRSDSGAEAKKPGGFRWWIVAVVAVVGFLGVVAGAAGAVLLFTVQGDGDDGSAPIADYPTPPPAMPSSVGAPAPPPLVPSPTPTPPAVPAPDPGGSAEDASAAGSAGGTVALIGVETDGLYTESRLRRRMRPTLRRIQECLGPAGVPAGEAPLFTVRVNADGRVTNVQANEGGWPSDAKECAARNLSQMDLGKPNGTRPGTLTMVLGSSE